MGNLLIFPDAWGANELSPEEELRAELEQEKRDDADDLDLDEAA